MRRRRGNSRRSRRPPRRRARSRASLRPARRTVAGAPRRAPPPRPPARLAWTGRSRALRGRVPAPVRATRRGPARRAARRAASSSRFEDVEQGGSDAAAVLVGVVERRRRKPEDVRLAEVADDSVALAQLGGDGSRAVAEHRELAPAPTRVAWRADRHAAHTGDFVQQLLEIAGEPN